MNGPLQVVTAESGFAYGVVGADLHVYGDGTPVYLLEEFHRPGRPDNGWLRELPSRMLDARSRLVEFTGRTAEVADLTGWLDEPRRLAVRWLCGTGGLGKTRLAEHLAASAQQHGWKVVVATHGVGAVQPSPGSQDMTSEGCAGILLLVDYADRWSLTSLIWLLRNALLFRVGVPARVLLCARSSTNWRSLRGEVTRPATQAGASSMTLEPLPDTARAAMYQAASAGIAAVYEVDATAYAEPTVALSDERFGLTLAVHLAALVAVDSHARRQEPVTDPARLTQYLLDREQAHWTRLFEGKVRQLDFMTPPSVMARTVFTAALTGTLPAADGEALLGAVEEELPASRILRDHGVCYPSELTLAPLYPDRLAEDYLAVTLLGGAAAQPWSAGRLGRLLGAAGTGPAANPARSVTFLVAAAARWPHVGHGHLYPFLLDRPGAAVQAGSQALSALARLPDVDLTMLEAVAAALPKDRHVDLDDGIAEISCRLLEHRLERAESAEARARLLLDHGDRLAQAGRRNEAVATVTQAIALAEGPADWDPPARLRLSADALFTLSSLLATIGDFQAALEAAHRAAAIQQRLARTDPGWLLNLACSLSTIGAVLGEMDRREDAVAAVEDAVRILRPVDATMPHRVRAELARSLVNMTARYLAVGRDDEALRAAEEAVAIYRDLAELQYATYTPELAAALGNLDCALAGVGRRDEAAAHASLALDLAREMSAKNPAAHRPALALALNNYGARLADAGRHQDALGHTLEAIQIREDLARAHRPKYLPLLATSLINAAICYSGLGRHQDAVASAERAVQLVESFAGTDGERLTEYGAALHTLSRQLSDVGRDEDALHAVTAALDVHRHLSARLPAAHNEALGRSLDRRCGVLHALGRHEEALQDADEAVAIFKELATQNRVLSMDGLTSALSSRGVVLSELGQHEAALTAGLRAVQLFRDLAAANPVKYETFLAQALNNLHVRYDNLGHAEEGTDALREALQIYERLLPDRPGTVAPGLAMAAHNMARRLTGTGRPEEALRRAEQALGLYRQLAQDHPDRHLANVGDALGVWSAALSGLARIDEALAAAAEGARIFADLTARTPHDYGMRYAALIDSLATRLAQVNRHEQALTCSIEAVSTMRSLAARRPDAHLNHLAALLNNLSLRYAESGHFEDSLQCVQESADLIRRLHRDHPEAYEPQLAEALTNVGATLGDLHRDAEALPYTAESVAIRRRLAERDGRAYGFDLAISLNTLADHHMTLGQVEEAAMALGEAVACCGAAAGHHPAYAAEQVGILCNYVLLIRSNRARFPQVLAAVGDMLEVLPRVHQAKRAAATENVRTTCQQLLRVLRQAGRGNDAAELLRLVNHGPG